MIGGNDMPFVRVEVPEGQFCRGCRYPMKGTVWCQLFENMVNENEDGTKTKYGRCPKTSNDDSLVKRVSEMSITNIQRMTPMSDNPTRDEISHNTRSNEFRLGATAAYSAVLEMLKRGDTIPTYEERESYEERLKSEMERSSRQIGFKEPKMDDIKSEEDGD